ncbi:uncharacterized protein LOC117174261 isoform X1 [Belonocnema kinseyi]|uniref:uncharacterized protein LOC117174261 isoform X1 n=1 Tax=Belonocnema kinseyi TaxID=2817044 RepID=UPI00143D3646|nr:uncharacterized protein LOC117174261 isoform X1 [Belonocnema kinseyi]
MSDEAIPGDYTRDRIKDLFREKKKYTYDQTTIENAIASIRRDKISIRRASVIHGVPRTTLTDVLNGKIRKRRKGPAPALTDNEETLLSEWCKDLYKAGFPLKTDFLLDSAKEMLEKDPKRKTPFVNNRPGRNWFQLFLKRHPQICPLNTECKSLVKGERPAKLKKWFQHLENYLIEKKFSNILQDPRRILSFSLATFDICLATNNVIPPQDWTSREDMAIRDKKECATTLIAYSASGEIILPMMIFGKSQPAEICQGLPADWLLGKSDTGLETYDTFKQFLSGLNDCLAKKGIQKPIILFADANLTFLPISITDFCNQKGIFLFALLPDKSQLNFFEPFEGHWRVVERRLKAQAELLDKNIKISSLVPILQEQLEAKSFLKDICEIFRLSGLYPYNPCCADFFQYNTGEFVEVYVEPEKEEFKLDEENLLVAENVIKKLSPRLRLRDLNVEMILEEIEKAKTRQGEEESVIDFPFVDMKTVKAEEGSNSDDSLDAVDVLFEDSDDALRDDN